MKEIKKNIFLIIIMLIIALFFFVVIKDNQILKEQNAQFLWDKEFYANELNKIHSKLEYQNSMIANTVQNSLEDQFQKGFECLIDNQ